MEFKLMCFHLLSEGMSILLLFMTCLTWDWKDLVGLITGFRAGSSCIDKIFGITHTIEKKKATNRELHLLFIDLTKTCDSEPLNKLWEILNRSDINTRLIEAIKSVHKGSSSKMNIGNLITKAFNVTKGLRKGCSLSPTLFKMYLERVLRNWKKK